MSIPWDNIREVAKLVGQHCPIQSTRKEVQKFLSHEKLERYIILRHPETIYAYRDGPRVTDSPIESEWRLEFGFSGDYLNSIKIEYRLVGP